MQKTQKKGFTLVELIVVITILAVLGTIAFISLQGYSMIARNSTRIADMKNVETVLELFSLSAGKYPLPGNSSDITASGGTVILWKAGIIDDNVQKQLERLSNVPFDPKTGDNMKYSTTFNQKEYELKYNFEIAYNKTVTHNAYADSDIPYVKGNYNKLYVLANNGVYYTAPGLHTTSEILDTSVDFELDNKTVSYQVAPLIHGGIVLTDTNIKDNYAYFGLALKSAYVNETAFNTDGIYSEVLALNNSTVETFVEHMITGTATPKSLTGWRILDPNCDIEDISIGTQVWAGCNSTIGIGAEYSVDQNCSDYEGGTMTGCNRLSDEKENIYSPIHGVNNIWGKLYTYANRDSACGIGYHVPSDDEWTTLENTLNGATCRTTSGSQCDGLGWAENNSFNPDRKLIETLQIPLSGFQNTDGISFFSRGFYAFLGSSTPSSTDAYARYLRWNLSTVVSTTYSQSLGFSIRCIKD